MGAPAQPLIVVSRFPDWPGLGRAREILIPEGGGVFEAGHFQLSGQKSGDSLEILIS